MTASVDDVASIVEVKATDGDARGAAAIANGVAAAFLARRRTADRQRRTRTRQDLQDREGTVHRLQGWVLLGL